MFEREEGRYLQEKALPVKMELSNGRVLSGNLIIARSSELREVINDNKKYIEFATHDGQKQFIAKKAIIQVEKIERPEEADQLMRRFNKLNAYNPYAVLGIESSAGKEEIQVAYHKLAKEYHPDRFVNIELPSEVMQYMIAMSKRVNAAYTELSSQMTSASMAS